MSELLSRRMFCASAGLAAVAAACSFAGCASRGKSGENKAAGESSNPANTVKVCTNGAFDYALCGYYIARSHGLFAEETLDVVEVKLTENMTMLECVNSGQARICFAAQDELAPMYAIDYPASIEAVAAFLQARDNEKGYQHLVVANDLFLVKHQDDARAFLRALEAGYRYCAEQAVEAAHEISELFEQVNLDECVRELQSLAAYIFDADGLWGTIDTKVWDARNTALLEEGAIDKPIYTHHGFNLDYLESNSKVT